MAVLQRQRLSEQTPRPCPPWEGQQQRRGRGSVTPAHSKAGRRGSESPVDSPPRSPELLLLEGQPPPSMTDSRPLAPALLTPSPRKRAQARQPDGEGQRLGDSPKRQRQPRRRWRAAPLPARPAPSKQASAAARAEQAAPKCCIEALPGEGFEAAVVRSLDAQLPEHKTATFNQESGVFDGAVQFDRLTHAVDKYVFRQPWDRLVSAYLWRSHAGLEDDVNATLRPLRPLPPRDGADPELCSTRVLEYDCSFELPSMVRLIARRPDYSWLERIEIDVRARTFTSYSRTPLWNDKFATTEFVQFYSAGEGATYCRKGAIVDTPTGYPPGWVCDWVRRSYSSRSHATCLELNELADTLDVGDRPRSEHPEVVRLREYLGMPPLSGRVPKRGLWAASAGRES